MCLFFFGWGVQFWVGGGGVCAEISLWSILSCTFILISIIRAEIRLFFYFKGALTPSFLLVSYFGKGWVCRIRSHEPERVFGGTNLYPVSIIRANLWCSTCLLMQVFITTFFIMHCFSFLFMFLCETWVTFLLCFYSEHSGISMPNVHVFTRWGSHSGGKRLSFPNSAERRSSRHSKHRIFVVLRNKRGNRTPAHFSCFLGFCCSSASDYWDRLEWEFPAISVLCGLIFFWLSFSLTPLCGDGGGGLKCTVIEFWKQIYPKNSAYHQGVSFLRRFTDCSRSSVALSGRRLGGGASAWEGLLFIFLFFKAIKSWLWPSSILWVHDVIHLLFPLSIHPSIHPFIPSGSSYTCSFLPHPRLSPSGVCWVQKKKKEKKSEKKNKMKRSLFLSSIWWDAL